MREMLLLRVNNDKPHACEHDGYNIRVANGQISTLRYGPTHVFNDASILAYEVSESLRG